MPGFTGQPDGDAGGRAGRTEPALELRLLAGGMLFRNMDEFRRALRHRYVLANFAGLAVPAIVLLFALDSTRMPIDLQVPAVVVGLVAAQVLLIAYVAAIAWLARMTRREIRIIRIWVTPGLMLGAAGLLATVHIMHQALGVQQDWTEVRSKLIPFFCWIYLEFAANHVFRKPMPRALANLRGGVNLFVDLPEGQSGHGDPVANVSEAMTDEDVPLQRGDLLFRLGIAPADILRLEASGNYVTVVTRAGRQLVPGPFSAVVAQMPPALGRQVQRSHWVAATGVEGVKKQGRDIWLQMACGASVPVSAAMKSEVQSWLHAIGKVGRSPMRDVPGQGVGGKVA